MTRRKAPIGDMPRDWLAALAIIGIAFLLGGILGCVIALQVGGQDGNMLAEYIQSYLTAANTGDSTAPDLLTVLWTALRFPVLTACLGFTAFGVVGLPVLFGVRGFLFSFAVTCFVSIYGIAGGLLAFLLLGLTGVISILPLFILGTQGMAASRKLLRRSLGARKESGIYSRRYFARCGICGAVLLLCVLFDYFAAPVLLRMLSGVWPL